ncbi:unnamed protein product [Nezara viridula]|uniref:Uncharacterized protein n=1 Tax=Nezara viridula TaxID=85310 RepID=A0A9P0MQK3_NEZVI|nr:unnamed protein product [Nezara viridula]
MEPRPLAIHKMGALVKQIQDTETGVPVPNTIQPPTKKRFFGFGGVGKKKSCAIAGAAAVVTASAGKGRGSDRSLTETAHEVPFCFTSKVPLSSSQSHLHELPVRDSGVSPEKTLPKMDASKGGLQVPGSSVM